MKDCCTDNLDDAIREGRNKYICAVCGCDVSFIWHLYQDSLLEDTKIKTKKRKHKEY